MPTDVRRHAPATHRNRVPLLEVLGRLVPPRAEILEVACGTGEHAVFFAAHQPGWVWHPTDLDPEARASVAAWTAFTGQANVRPPQALDARSEVWPVTAVDAVFSSNMVHISPWEATLGLLRGAGRVLKPGGLLLLYGPYAMNGAHTAPSNAAFDESLRRRDPRWGVRHLEEVVAEASRQGLVHRQTVSMPANNQVVVFARAAGDPVVR